MQYRLSFFGLMATITCSSNVFSGPPVPFLDPNEPGINFQFSGDPNTTEDGCSQDAARAVLGAPSGKNHNELLDCDNWDFKPRDWGQAAFLQGAFILGVSPFSNDGGWECPGNQGPSSGKNPCANSTVRAVATYQNTPSPGPGLFDGVPMDDSKDWVFSFDFKIEVAPGDTYGNDKLFEAIGLDNYQLMEIRGGGNNASSFLPDGTPDRYRMIQYQQGRVDIQGQEVFTPIDVPMPQGHITLHYKAADQRMDLWLNDTKILENIESSAGYDISKIQLGGGGISFENALYDNVILGVLAAECGSGGAGALPADFNCDGVIDVADLGILGANFNLTEMIFSDGDANGDGAVDVADLGILGANWSGVGQLSGGQGLQGYEPQALIPEPVTVSVLAISVLVLGYRQRN